MKTSLLASRSVFAAVLFLAAGLPLVVHGAGDPPVRVLTIRGTIPDLDSVKVSFAPVPGAADYRIYEADHPEKVKYAGLLHRPDPAHPGHFQSSPATRIEWNGLTPGKPTSLIVEAVDQLGPLPPANRLTDDHPMADGMPPPMPAMMDDSPMIGSNAGRTPDTRISINGQGMSSRMPQVLARSRPIIVTATGKAPLPSGREAAQVLFDTFASGEISAIPPAPDTRATSTASDERRYTLRTPQATWDILFQGSDLAHSQPFVMDRHFMDLLFDGASAGQPHRGKSACALSPQQTADFSGGRVLHLTMEVDGHLDGHRWMGFNLAPADDPLTDFYWAHRGTKVNRTNRSFFCEITDTRLTFGVIDGAAISAPLHSPGPLQTQGDVRSGVMTARQPGNGQGLDNRCRFDLFLSRDHYALYEDGKRACEGRIEGGIPFEQAKVYFTHFLYHSADERFALQTHAPHERYWIEQFPYSDERHWDNLGFEVLPATTDWPTIMRRAASSLGLSSAL